MSTNIESAGVHPIVILTISDFFNRMKINTKDPNIRVYGALMGLKTGTKLEIFSAFEFVNTSTDPSKLNLDIDYIDKRREIATKLCPNFDIIGFFTTSDNTNPSEKDKEIIKILDLFGVVNPLYLLLNTKNIDKATELPLEVYMFDKDLSKFEKIPHVIEGWESERICLETVMKNTNVSSKVNPIVTNLQNTKNALSVLKQNLDIIKNNLGKHKDDKVFKEMLDDVIINYPNIIGSDYQKLLEEKGKEILALNNLCASAFMKSMFGHSGLGIK